VRHAFILDYTRFEWVHLHPRIFLRLRPTAALLEAYYPEFVGGATCVNAPPLFVHLWAVVSPWLSPGVRERVSTADAEHTPDALKRIAPPHALPCAYGGTCAAPPDDVCAALGVEACAMRAAGYDEIAE
jgi:hypothetical protein